MSNLFLNLNNEQKGPFGVDQVNQMLASGEATVETSAWMEGMEGWEPLSSATFSALGVGAAAEQPSQEPAASPDPAPQTTRNPKKRPQRNLPLGRRRRSPKKRKGFLPTLLLCFSSEDWAFIALRWENRYGRSHNTHPRWGLWNLAPN